MGWSGQDATAPFNVVDSAGNVLAVIDQNGVTVYNPTTGQKVVMNPAAADIEIFDASGKQVVLANGNGVTVSPSGSTTTASMSAGSTGTAEFNLNPGQDPANKIFNGVIYATNDQSTDYVTRLYLMSPFYQNGGGSSPAEIVMTGMDKANHPTQIDISADEVTIEGRSVPRGIVAGFSTRAGTVAQTPTNGAETAMTAWDSALSSTGVTLVQGRAYRLKMYVRCWDTVSEAGEARVLVRNVIGSITANIWAQISVPIPSTGSNVETGYFESHLFKNSPTFTYHPGYTIARTQGAGQVGLYGDGSYANTSLRLIIEDIGAISDQPPIDAIVI